MFSSFTPYPGSEVRCHPCHRAWSNSGSGRESIVTAPGPGDAPQIKTFRWDLYKPDRARAGQRHGDAGHSSKPNDPTMTSQFLAYDESYTGGIVAVDRLGRRRRGRRQEHRHRATRRATAPCGSGRTGRGWTGSPAMYLDNPNHHEENVKYAQIASFAPFPGADAGRDGGDHQHDLRGRSSGQRAWRRAVTRCASSRLRAPDPDAKTVAPKLVAALPLIPGVGAAAPLGGR